MDTPLTEAQHLTKVRTLDQPVCWSQIVSVEDQINFQYNVFYKVLPMTRHIQENLVGIIYPFYPVLYFSVTYLRKYLQGTSDVLMYPRIFQIILFRGIVYLNDLMNVIM